MLYFVRDEQFALCSSDRRLQDLVRRKSKMARIRAMATTLDMSASAYRMVPASYQSKAPPEYLIICVAVAEPTTYDYSVLHSIPGHEIDVF